MQLKRYVTNWDIRHQVIAFGDSMNDKSMFEVAGLAIAMGNASDELKQYADEITLDHNENGIPHALKNCYKF